MMDNNGLRFGLAQQYFESRDYRSAIPTLVDLLDESPDNLEVRMLLARSYFHSALLAPAEEQLRAVIERAPTETYAHLMLARTLERQSRHDEAATYRRMVAAFTGDDSLLAARSHAAA